MSRRTARGRLLLLGCALMLTLTLTLTTPGLAQNSGPQPGLTKIGIIGAGKMGSILAGLWAQAGYQVMISSRHPEELCALARSIGPNVHIGTPVQAAVFGDAVLIAVPYGAEPQVGKQLAPQLAHKIVIDLGNPYPARDGPMAVQARHDGTGSASSRFFPGVRLARAFNALTSVQLRADAHRAGEPVAVPIAADDAATLAIVSRLVRAAGYAPVIVGPLSTARSFDVGSAVYLQPMSATQLRARLGLPVR